jgi:diaminopimelate decarboxylase
VAYASKAYLNLALAQLFAQEGLALDVVSGGELYVARRADFPAERIHFHGNNKSLAELRMALDEGVGRVVVDNDYELDLLVELAAERRESISIWLRLSPAIDVHTHDYRKTGLLDSKFGFSLGSGAAERALERALASPELHPVGLHAHIGSQIFEVEPFAETVRQLLGFSAAMRANYGFELHELSPGGGLGVPSHKEDAASTEGKGSARLRYVQAVSLAVAEGCKRHDLPLPKLALEPGRSIVANAAVALYTVGARKEIPGVRTYVSVDGGMADNIRPALYGARYSAIAVGKGHLEPEETVTVSGKFCESGDVLIRDAALPYLSPGRLLAVPGVGAYCLSLANNYNLATRPAVVLVQEGEAILIQRRESFSDLIARDQSLPL